MGPVIGELNVTEQRPITAFGQPRCAAGLWHMDDPTRPKTTPWPHSLYLSNPSSTAMPLLQHLAVTARFNPPLSFLSERATWHGRGGAVFPWTARAAM